MTCRKRKRAERLAILKEIEMLNRDRCKDCTVLAISNDNNSRCGCPAAVRIRELGNRLMRTTPRAVVDETPRITDVELTVEGYKALKGRGIKDRNIAKYFKIGESKLSRWKKDHDLLSFKVRNKNREELLI